MDSGEFYTTGSGRIVRPVVDPDFVGHEELEKYLQGEGVTWAELEDDEKHGFGGKYCPRDRGHIKYTSVTEEEVEGDLTASTVCDFIEKMELEDLCKIWFDREPQAVENKAVLCGLLRYPGGLHEWLMIAGVPLYKEMGISIQQVKDIRTETTKTPIYVGADCSVHGSRYSTEFHNYLKACICKAYTQWKKDGGDSLAILKKHMGGMVKKYYRDDWNLVPATFRNFLRS